jgi:hypothetical protein
MQPIDSHKPVKMQSELINLKNTVMQEQKLMIEDRKILKHLAKAGKIKWPVLVNWPANKKPYQLYCDEIETIGERFEYNGKKYALRYLSGCFFPYLFLIKD